MKVTEFAIKVSQHEGLKKQTNIAQIKENLKVINALTCGELYKMIRRLSF